MTASSPRPPWRAPRDGGYHPGESSPEPTTPPRGSAGASSPRPAGDCWCEPTPAEPHPWKPCETNLCDPDGVVRRGAMHHGQDYACTGSAHWSGLHIRCTTAIHGQGPLPIIGWMPKGGFR